MDRRLLAPLLLILPLLTLAPTPVTPGRARSCARAQIVDGRLRCDEELLSVCGDAAVGAGERIETRTCAHAPMSAEDLAALSQVVDINEAGVDALTSLPRIGSTLAARIVAGRPYGRVEELLEVRGIGPATLARLRPRVRVSASP